MRPGGIVLVLGAAVVCVTALATAAPERRGKVVRIERPRAVVRTALRFCPVPDFDQGRGTCYGGKPAVGDEGELYDLEGYRGAIRIDEVTPAAQDHCGTNTAFDFSYTLIDRPPGAPSGFVPNLIAVFGLDVRRDAGKFLQPYSLSSPSGNPGERVWLAMDADGSGDADILATAYQCTPPAGAPQTAGGASVYPLCLDYWSRGGSVWNKAVAEVFLSCL